MDNDPIYACIDPNWGDPKPMLDTLSWHQREARAKAVISEGAALYSGAQLSRIPPLPGEWERLEKHGYRIARVQIEILN